MDCHALDLHGRHLRRHRLAVRRHARPGPGAGPAGDGPGDEARRTRLVIAFGYPAALEFLQFFLGALRSVAPDFRGPPRRSAAAGVPDVRPGGPAPAADRGRTATSRSTDRRAAGFASGQDIWDWCCTATRSPACWSPTSARTNGRDCTRSSTACSASALERMGEPSSKTRQHRHWDKEVIGLSR